MAAKTKFKTEADIARLNATDEDVLVRDALTPGLILRVSWRTGAKSFVFEYRRDPKSAPTKATLGVHGAEPPALTLKAARAKVVEIKASLNRGTDPLAPPPPKVAVASLIDHYKTLNKPSDDTIRILDKQIAPTFGKRDPLSIKTYEVASWHAAFTKAVKVKEANDKVIGTEQQPAEHKADKALDIFKALINFGMEKDYMPFAKNPCKGVDKHLSAAESERAYPWSNDEVKRLGDLLDKYERIAYEEGTPTPVGINLRAENGRITAHVPSLWTVYAVRLIALMGLRKSEALTLKWSQIDRTLGTITWGRRVRTRRTSKHKAVSTNGVQIKIITDEVAAILDKLEAIRPEGCPFVFPGRAGADITTHMVEIDGVWVRIREHLNLRTEDGLWARPHDLRHMFGQEAADAGLEGPRHREQMGHASASANLRYNRASLNARKRNAERVARRIAAKFAGESVPDAH